MHKICSKWLPILLVVAVILAVPVAGQVSNTHKLSCVPPEARDKLVKQLEQFIQFDRAHEYERQFNLLSRSYLESNRFDRESYVEFKRKEVRGTLLGVKIYNATIDLQQSAVQMSVAAKTRHRGNIVNDRWLITAYLQAGEWHFDYTWVDF